MKKSSVNIGFIFCLFALACCFLSSWLLPSQQAHYVILGVGALMVIGLVIDLITKPIIEAKKQLLGMLVIGAWGTSLSLLFSVDMMINISLVVGSAWVVWRLIEDALDKRKRPSA